MWTWTRWCRRWRWWAGWIRRRHWRRWERRRGERNCGRTQWTPASPSPTKLTGRQLSTSSRSTSTRRIRRRLQQYSILPHALAAVTTIGSTGTVIPACTDTTGSRHTTTSLTARRVLCSVTITQPRAQLCEQLFIVCNLYLSIYLCVHSYRTRIKW